MGYAIITNRGCGDMDCPPTCRGRKIERREVDTFYDAMSWVQLEVFMCEFRENLPVIDHRFNAFYEQVWDLTEAGGSIGPLPWEDMRVELVMI